MPKPLFLTGKQKETLLDQKNCKNLNVETIRNKAMGCRNNSKQY